MKKLLLSLALLCPVLASAQHWIYQGSYVVHGNISWPTNAWSGPTNVIDMTQGALVYNTYTPMQITGFINVNPAARQGVSLYVENLASTNITVTLPNKPRTIDGTKSLVITNGTACYIGVETWARTNITWQKYW